MLFRESAPVESDMRQVGSAPSDLSRLPSDLLNEMKERGLPPGDARVLSHVNNLGGDAVLKMSALLN